LGEKSSRGKISWGQKALGGKSPGGKAVLFLACFHFQLGFYFWCLPNFKSAQAARDIPAEKELGPTARA